MEPDRDRTISDYWADGVGWRLSLLGISLPASILLPLSNAPLPSNTTEKDVMYWLVVDGRFSIKSAYDLAVE